MYVYIYRNKHMVHPINSYSTVVSHDLIRTEIEHASPSKLLYCMLSWSFLFPSFLVSKFLASGTGGVGVRHQRIAIATWGIHHGITASMRGLTHNSNSLLVSICVLVIFFEVNKMDSFEGGLQQPQRTDHDTRLFEHALKLGDIFFQIDFIGCRALWRQIAAFCPMNPSTEFGFSGKYWTSWASKRIQCGQVSQIEKYAICSIYTHTCTFQEWRVNISIVPWNERNGLCNLKDYISPCFYHQKIILTFQKVRPSFWPSSLPLRLPWPPSLVEPQKKKHVAN